MSFLQFLRGDVENVMSGVDQQKQIVSNTLDSIKSLVPRVTMSWIGGDAEEFAADVMRKIVPAMVELIAAIAGINLNLTKATNIVDQADQKVKSLADGLGDLFSGIC
jgi:WXG100 family type VII secretion target